MHKKMPLGLFVLLCTCTDGHTPPIGHYSVHLGPQRLFSVGVSRAALQAMAGEASTSAGLTRAATSPSSAPRFSNATMGEPPKFGSGSSSIPPLFSVNFDAPGFVDSSGWAAPTFLVIPRETGNGGRICNISATLSAFTSAFSAIPEAQRKGIDPTQIAAALNSLPASQSCEAERVLSCITQGYAQLASEANAETAAATLVNSCLSGAGGATPTPTPIRDTSAANVVGKCESSSAGLCQEFTSQTLFSTTRSNTSSAYVCTASASCSRIDALATCVNTQLGFTQVYAKSLSATATQLETACTGSQGTWTLLGNGDAVREEVTPIPTPAPYIVGTCAFNAFLCEEFYTESAYLAGRSTGAQNCDRSSTGCPRTNFTGECRHDRLEFNTVFTNMSDGKDELRTQCAASGGVWR